MSWRVHLARKASKQFVKLPEGAQLALRALVADIQANGPIERTGSTIRRFRTRLVCTIVI